MLKIDRQNNIYLTRGDTAYLEVDLFGYGKEVVEGDMMRFAVKKNYQETSYIIDKTFQPNEALVIEPEETKDYDCGKYVYDIELDTTKGEVFTVSSANLYLKEEVAE